MGVEYPVFGISATEQLVEELLFGGLALAALIYCVLVARRLHEIWPIAVFGGSALLVIYEPFNNLLAHCAYPTVPHQHQILGFLGQHVPVATWLIYMFYFSFAVPMLMQKLDAGMTGRAFVRFYAVTVVICAAFEPLFANTSGLRWWYYYGDNQAFNLTGMPMFWAFANAMVVVGMATIFHLLKKHLFTRDLQTLTFVPLAPLILFGLHGSAGIPVFIAITSTEGKGWSSVATLVSMAIGFLYIWFMIKAACITKSARTDESVYTPAEVAPLQPVITR